MLRLTTPFAVVSCCLMLLSWQVAAVAQVHKEKQKQQEDSYRKLSAEEDRTVMIHAPGRVTDGGDNTAQSTWRRAYDIKLLRDVFANVNLPAQGMGPQVARGSHGSIKWPRPFQPGLPGPFKPEVEENGKLKGRISKMEVIDTWSSGSRRFTSPPDPRAVVEDIPSSSPPELKPESITGEVHAIVVQGVTPYFCKGDPSIVVRVTRKSAPLVLYLSAYSYVHWRVYVEPGAIVSAVFIESDQSASVSGIDPSVPVYKSDFRTQIWEPQGQDMAKLKGSEGDLRSHTENTVKSTLNRNLASYQYKFEATGFSI